MMVIVKLKHLQSQALTPYTLCRMKVDSVIAALHWHVEALVRGLDLSETQAPVEASQGKSTILPAICWKAAETPVIAWLDTFPVPALSCTD